MRLIKSRAFAIVLLFIALSSQTSLFSQQSQPRISYRIQVNSADLSGFNVEMRIRGARDTVRIAMAAHPEYDDGYWRYVENLTAESRGAKLEIKNEESAVWSVRTAGGDLAVKYRIQLPSQTTPHRSVWKPFLSPTGGLIGDVHSLMYVVGAELAPAQVTLDLPNDWKIASGLETTRDPQTFSASSVELLLDSPIVVGQFQQWDFVVNGLKHQVVYLPLPNATAFDTVTFVDGIKKLVTEAFKIAGKAPYKQTRFSTRTEPSGHSNTLIPSRLARGARILPKN